MISFQQMKAFYLSLYFIYTQFMLQLVAVWKIHTHKHKHTQYFEFHLPRKAPQSPLLNSSLQKQSQGSNPQSQDLLFFFASKCKWKSLFYKRLIERLREEAVASHWFPTES